VVTKSEYGLAKKVFEANKGRRRRQGFNSGSLQAFAVCNRWESFIFFGITAGDPWTAIAISAQ
jgi:hypothetical protein